MSEEQQLQSSEPGLELEPEAPEAAVSGPDAAPAPVDAEIEALAAIDEPPARPADVPEKFWDGEVGAVRVDALVKSYRELERKLGSMVALPEGEGDLEAQQRLRKALGVPASADDYRIETRDELLEPDPEVNAKLHEAGFTTAQAQLVYDLAAQHLLPLVDDVAEEAAAQRDAERLASHFGGDDSWRRLAPQIKTWGQANLAPEVFETLSSSYDGVLALHQMMQAREPAVLQDGEAPSGPADQAALAQMMRDARYWRERDPAFIAQVTEGFKRLYAR